MTIRALRKERGWSQQQLADMAGVTRRTVQRVEQGSRASVETLKALAAVFDVDFRSLRTETLDSSQGNASYERERELEEQALAYGRRMKDFLQVASCYLVLAILFLILFRASMIMIMIFAALGFCVLIQGLVAFDILKFMNPNYEREVAAGRLGRKL